MRLRLTPPDGAFSGLFTRQAEYLVTGAGVVAQMVGASSADQAPLAEELAELERDCDRTTHDILGLLSSSYVTPFDREDIHALARAVGACMYRIEAAGDRLLLSRVVDWPAGTTEQVDLLQRAAAKTHDVMQRLRRREDLAAYWVAIDSLTTQFDRSHRRLVVQVQDTRSAADAARIGEVLDELVAAMGAFRPICSAIETIAIKV